MSQWDDDRYWECEEQEGEQIVNDDECPWCLLPWYECDCDEWGFDDDDGQPSEYDEWQDYMGGDDWDFGQYDCED